MRALKFLDHHSGGKRAVVFFKNGYGASILCGDKFYSDGKDTYELAVLKGNKDKFEIDYTTGLTEDVLGHITQDKVENTLVAIEHLE